MNAPMTPPTTPPKSAPPTAAPARAASKPTVNAVTLTSGSVNMAPPRIIINGVEGWGKTSAAAFSPEPAILMARDETGYLTLLGAGLVPDVPRATVDDWPSLLAFLDAFAQDTQGRKTLVLDALGGFERMCHEHVCRASYKNNWTEFQNYHKGYDVSVADWMQLLSRLDRIQSQGVAIVLLSHVKVATFNDPLNAPYDRYQADLHKFTWGPTHKWADAVLFGTFLSVVEGNRGDMTKKGKGVGGTTRVVHCVRRDAYDAKNRYNMPDTIDIPDDPAQVWATISSHIYTNG